MTPTEISEHAKEAAKSFRTLELKDFPYDIGSAFDISVHRAIQHGINLAVEEKDRRIAELEAELHSIKRRFAEDWADYDTELRALCVPIVGQEFCDGSSFGVPSMVDCAEKAVETLTAQLTEANAKLARKTEQSETWLSELQSVNEKLRSLDTHCSDVEAEKSSALAKLSSAQAEIERLKEAMKQIWDETDPYADGTPDSGAMALLANQISGIARQFVFLTPTK